VNEDVLEIDPGRGTAPLVHTGRTMLPIRAAVEAIGGSVAWDSAERRTTLDSNGRTVEMVIGSRNILVDQRPETMDVAPFIENERTFLPLRFVAENLGYKIEWIGSQQRVIIVYNMPLPE
jgi:hypothetical protein